MSIAITEADNDQVKIKIRSRADIKKPTCSLDAIAQKLDDNTYQTSIDGKSVLFRFTDKEISITTENEEDEGLLYFYCAGGASLKGTYLRLNNKLDQSQIDKTQFSQVLNLPGIGFNVSSIKKDGVNTISIFTFGLEQREYIETFDIKGEKVIGAEVEDLNSDGSPELFVYSQSIGSGSYGNVYADRNHPWSTLPNL